jgi:hypothetical protein
MDGNSAESASNNVLRDLPLLISTHIFAVMTARKANYIQASWTIASPSHPD